MSKLVSVGAAIVLSLATYSVAHAQQAYPAGGGGAPYGTAGCGLGSIVLGNSAGIVQIFAATTNGTSGSQTFGITSGTSNCINPMGPAGATASFVETNREVLAKDIARGSGETIKTLSTLAGCKDHKLVATTLQSKFDAIFTSAAVTNVEVSGRLLSILRTDKSLSCKKLQAKKTKKTKKKVAKKTTKKAKKKVARK